MTKATDIDFSTFENFAPSMLRQMKQLLLKHLHENKETWFSYHTHMVTVVGVKDLKGKDKPLHERDPRNWIIDGHTPQLSKLRLYGTFIQRTYPDFEFSDTETKDHIALGTALARFSIGEAEIGHKSLSKNAARLDGKFFMSKSYHRNELNSEQPLLNVMTMKAVTETPFLMIFRFSLLMPFDAGQDIEKAAIRMDQEFGANKEGRMPILYLQKGILAPLAKEGDYHGMMQSADYCPEYIILKKSKISDAFLFEGLSPQRKDLDAHAYHLVPRLPHFHQMVSELGDIIL